MKNPGKTYRRKGQPIKVKTHDFPDKELGKAVPYGVYDLSLNEAGVSVGIGHDTAEFAVGDTSNSSSQSVAVVGGNRQSLLSDPLAMNWMSSLKMSQTDSHFRCGQSWMVCNRSNCSSSVSRPFSAVYRP
jgi:hypothetical protein